MRVEDYLDKEAMHYYDKPNDDRLSAQLLQKKYDMIDNKDNKYMATQKWDGYWMMFVRGEGNDSNACFIRGRNMNKQGCYENYGLKLPHLVEEMLKWPENTVVLGEVCWPQLNKVATDVGVILRCLPEKAIARQSQSKLIVKAFDILCLRGEDLGSKVGYKCRYNTLKSFCSFYKSDYIDVTNVCYDDFMGFADSIIGQGGEGCVIQLCDNLYEYGKRSAWHTLKLKQHLDTATYPVLGFLNPTREYSGKEADTWEYKDEDGTLVTKPYALKWKVGVTIGLPSGHTCDVSSGLTDADREWASSDEAQSLLQDGKLFVNVRAMQEATLGGLRHPVFEGWEFDKDVQR